MMSFLYSQLLFADWLVGIPSSAVRDRFSGFLTVEPLMIQRVRHSGGEVL